MLKNYQSQASKLNLLLVLLIAGSLVHAAPALIDPSVTSVSTKIDSNTQAQGSQQGGTILYIRGTDFSSDSSLISVFIGPYPCILQAEGASTTMIVCSTTAATDPNSLYWLPTTVKIVGFASVTCTVAACRFSYSEAFTPLIHEIIPKTAAGSDIISVCGVHRVVDVGDGRSNGVGEIKNLLIDETLCSMIDISQEDLIQNYRDDILCRVWKNQIAGEYNFKEKTVVGDANVSIRAHQTSSLTGKNYVQRVAAKIDSTAYIPTQGGVKGHLLRLTGTGFPQDISKFTCQVAGQACEVIGTLPNEITVSIPPYDPNNLNKGILAQEATDSSTQQLPYVGSNGFLYTRYQTTTWKAMPDWVTFLRTQSATLTKLEEKVVYELSSGQTYGSDYIEHIRGYFYVPMAGDYTFWGIADDRMIVQLSSVSNNANPANLQPILTLENYVNDHYNPYIRQDGLNTFTATRSFPTAGYYYMEIVTSNGWGSGYYKLSVQTPLAVAPVNVNPTWQIDYISVEQTSLVPEIITVQVNVANLLASGQNKFKLYYVVLENGLYVTKSSYMFTLGDSAATFKDKLSGCIYLDNYDPAVALTAYDASNTITTDTSLITKYVYTLTLNKYRTPAENLLPYVWPATGITVTRTQVHSTPLAGTYRILLNGTALPIWGGSSFNITDIPYNTNWWDIQSAFRFFYKANEIEVRQVMHSRFSDQIKFVILYYGVSEVLSIGLTSSLLTGGTASTFITAYRVERPYSSAPYYDAVPLDFLKLPHAKPTFTLTANSIPVICDTCEYNFNNLLSIPIASSSLTGNTLTLSVPDQATIGFTLNDLEVKLLGTICSIDMTGTISNFNCVFALNSANNILVQAGSAKPTVHIRQVGFADASGINALYVALQVNGMNPTLSGVYGGMKATLTGSGFPLKLSQIGNMQISLCGNIVQQYLSISNTNIEFVIPQQVNTCANSSSSFISFNSQTTYIPNFLYDPNLTPVVTSLSLNSASPILKTHINIIGTGFTNNIKAYLYDISGIQKYQLTVVSVANSTFMTCILGGGRSGNYFLRVVQQSGGISAAAPSSALSYEIVVNTVSPVTGPLGGGYILTINGQNFASKDSHNVFIGDGSSMCKVLTSTATQITCMMPRIDSLYQSSTPLKVVVVGRIVEESVCRGTCSFSYDESVTSNVTVPAALTYNAGDLVSITGDSLTGVTVEIGGKPVALLAGATSTSISFNYPALPAGQYEIKVNTGSGLTHPAILTTTKLSLGNSLTNKGSLAGNLLPIAANGLPETVGDSNLNVYMVCAGIKELVKINELLPNKLTLQLVPKTEQTCNINVTINEIFKVYPYTYALTNTHSITVTSAANNVFNVVKDATTIYTQISAVYTDLNGNPTTSAYPMTITPATSTTFSIQPTGGYLPNGIFILQAISQNGFASVTPSTFTINSNAVFTSSPATTSFAGDLVYNIKGAGFISNHPENNHISVCGLRSQILQANQTDIMISLPPLVTAQTHQQYLLGKDDIITGSLISDGGLNPEHIFDGSSATHYSSVNEYCYVGQDFGSGAIANIKSIRFMPDPSWNSVASHLAGAVFEGSNDLTTWSNIFSVNTNQVHSGWNVWVNNVPNSVQYRYVRFNHTSKSTCSLAEIEITGIVYSLQVVNPSTDKTCPIVINIPGNPITLSSSITYSHATTSTVTKIEPAFGPSSGGTTIKLTGFNFASTLFIQIDGISCSIVNTTSTVAYCLTGSRPSPPTQGNSFIFTSNGNSVILATAPFYYIDRWSSQATWGGEALPRAGDSVYVPVGMSLLVDVSTPILNSVIVENGRLVFADESDLTFDAKYVVINGGEFQIGTQAQPYTHNLVITLHGNPKDKQLPMFGSKVIGCRNCKLDIHGLPRNITWTEIQSTVLPGATSIRLLQAVDWQVGEQIVIAGTSFDHTESEQRTISAVSTDRQTITLSTPLKFRHYSAVETYNGQSFPMRAEVGLLSRNIKIRGDDTSTADKYGSHLLMTGKAEDGLVGRISYAEFSQCGQSNIVGRYCTHFHMAGEMQQSYIRGLAVHHSNARVLTIHGTHFLLVEKNVGYHVEGHNIFIQDGIETNNVIQDNLMISSIASLTLLQSDITVASYWVTNPANTLRRNHAAGGDFYGIWYEIKDHPDGPSATSDICPQGLSVGESRDNVAHSNRRFGLRIFKLSARQYPCLPTKNESAIDIYADNPAIESVFDNYTLWMNEQCGFLGEELGYTTIKNFKTADSRKGGLQFHKTNYTLEDVVTKNTLVVGFSQGNAPANIDSLYEDSRGLITSRTDGLRIDTMQFHNFGPTMTPLQSCSECHLVKLWVTGGKTTTFTNVSYFNVNGNYIFWQNWRREIFIDEDGSLTRPISTSLTLSKQAGTVTPFRPSLLIPGHCHHITGAAWNDSVYCDATVTLRGVTFTNAIPELNFKTVDIRVALLTDPYDNFTTLGTLNSDFSSEPMILIKKSKDIPFSWALPFATNQYYNVHWKEGIDFTHMSIAPSRLWTANDGVVLRFNYTDVRELYEIGKWYQQQLQKPFINASAVVPSPDTCSNGDYFHDKDNRYLFVCVSGLNKEVAEWTDINGVRCLNYCPPPVPVPMRETFERLWSNTTQWPNQALPLVGVNVTVPYEWNLILDIDPPVLGHLEINGYLIFDRRRDNLLQAHSIWVKKGKIQIGTAARPFTNQAQIRLHGVKDDKYLLIDPEASGNKILAVTGGLQFFGVAPATPWTKLSQIASVGANSIKVIDSTGWQVGDKIVVAPSYSGQTEYQKFVITAISGNTITLDSALQFEHYGAAATTIQNTYGTLDTRAAVGILNRNIKISSNSADWGCRVLIYGYLEMPTSPTDQPKVRNGYAKWNGVELENCAQIDNYAGLQIRNVGKHAPVEITTEISDSSIHSCWGICTQIIDAYNSTFNNNIFYWARKFLVYVETVGNYTFSNNLLIGARSRPELAATLELTHMIDDVSCYEQYFQPDGYVQIYNNLAQGSEGQGFVFPITTCALLPSYGFYDNTAGSAEVAFMFAKFPGQACIGASRIAAYASEIGLMANLPGSQTQLIYEKMMFADNQRGITLRYGHDIDDNTCILRDSYFTGFSRPNCPSCYGPTTIKYCNSGYAVRMFTATISGEIFPLKKKNTNHDVICTQQAYDAKAFLSGVTFENYLTTNTQLPYCSSMSVFRRHLGASDATASHYLTNTKCVNCDQSSWARFDAPDVNWRGWFGGCGELDCTGPNNYFIFDQDGTFTGQISQLLANNTVIGSKESACTSLPVSNGHWCKFDKLGILEYESIAPDFNKRIMWPVNLSYTGGQWESETNGWKEWQWDGKEPMNLRLGRFWSTIKLFERYNLKYKSTPPMDSRFQIQKRQLPSGNPNDWTIIKIAYPLPNSLQIRVKNDSGTDILVRPFIIKQNITEDLMNHLDFCGANNFYYENGTIQFVVNGLNNCQVRVVVINTMKLTARLDIPIADFYTNSGATTFINNICAFLGIDTSQLKIVGISSGSTVIECYASLSSPTPLQISRNVSSDHNSAHKSLTNVAQKLSAAVLSGSVNLGAPVLSFNSQVIVHTDSGQLYTGQEDAVSSNMTTILAVAISISLVMVGLISLYCWKKSKNEAAVAPSFASESIANINEKKNVQITDLTEVDM